MMETDRFPVLNVAEGLYFYTWVLVTLSLVLTKVLRVEFIVFFTNVIGFSMMAIHTFTPSDLHSAELTGKLTSESLRHSYYDGHFIIRRFFTFICFFTPLSISISFAEKEKVGKMAFEN